MGDEWVGTKGCPATGMVGRDEASGDLGRGLPDAAGVGLGRDRPGRAAHRQGSDGKSPDQDGGGHTADAELALLPVVGDAGAPGVLQLLQQQAGMADRVLGS